MSDGVIARPWTRVTIQASARMALTAAAGNRLARNGVGPGAAERAGTNGSGLTASTGTGTGTGSGAAAATGSGAVVSTNVLAASGCGATGATTQGAPSL